MSASSLGFDELYSLERVRVRESEGKRCKGRGSRDLSIALHWWGYGDRKRVGEVRCNCFEIILCQLLIFYFPDAQALQDSAC